MKTLSDLSREFGVTATAIAKWRDKAGDLPFIQEGRCKFYEQPEIAKMVEFAPRDIREKWNASQAQSEQPEVIDAEPVEVGVSNGLVVQKLDFMTTERGGAIAALSEDISKIAGIGGGNVRSFIESQIAEAHGLGRQLGMMKTQAMMAGMAQAEAEAMSANQQPTAQSDVRVHGVQQQSVGGQPKKPTQEEKSQ